MLLRSLKKVETSRRHSTDHQNEKDIDEKYYFITNAPCYIVCIARTSIWVEIENIVYSEYILHS